MGQGDFYDDIAGVYDLIFEDWAGSMARQGAAIAGMLGREPVKTRVLDVSAGIGTQSLPLAEMGFNVTARDLSPGAVDRLRREAHERGLQMDVAASDMRGVGQSVTGLFDAILSFDNSIPHLLTDDDIVAALRGFSRLLAPGGTLLLSVRDYDKVDRSPTSTHDYGERVRGGRRYRLRQEWVWYDASHYRTEMIVEEARQGRWKEAVRTRAAYYAIPVARLLDLMREAGFSATRLEGVRFYQPVLRGRLDVAH